MKAARTGKAAQPARTKETMLCGNRHVPLYTVKTTDILNPRTQIPVFGRPAAKGTLHILREEDLLPARPALLHAGPGHFGDLRLDSFHPRYGSFPVTTRPRFLFEESRLPYTTNTYWVLERDATLAYDPYLAFSIETTGLGGIYLTVNLGLTIWDSTDRTSILTVQVNGVRTDLDVSPVSGQSIRLVSLPSAGNVLEIIFSIRADANQNTRATCPIRSMDLYETIRAFPSDLALSE